LEISGTVAQDLAHFLQIRIYVNFIFAFSEKCREIGKSSGKRENLEMNFHFEKSEDVLLLKFEVGAVQKSLNLVDRVKSFHTSIYYLHIFTCKNQLRYRRERASQSL